MVDGVTIAIGDTHFPYHHGDCFSWILEEIKRITKNKSQKIKAVYQMGDLFDQYTLSRFPKRQIATVAEELAEARVQAERFWHLIQKATKHSPSYHQILGNHDVRIHTKTLQHLGEVYELLEKPIQNLYAFERVETQESYRHEHRSGGVMYLHGYLGRLGDHMRKNLCSCVVGHSHRGGVVFDKIGNSTMFELNAGHMADENQLPLQYGPQRFKNWVKGMGVLDQLGPRFIPYPH